MFHKVIVEKKIMICDCKDDIFYGVPCRHEMAIALKTPQISVNLLPFLKSWQLNYFKEREGDKEPETLPKSEADIVYIVFKFIYLQAA